MQPKQSIFTQSTRYHSWWTYLLVVLFLVAGSLLTLAQPVSAQSTPGAALDFDGSNDYVTLPATLNQQFGSNRITVAGWFYPTASPVNYIALIGEQYTDDGNIRFVLYQADAGVGCGFESSSGGWTQTSLVAWNLNTWQHVACTYDQQNIKLYINGAVVATKAATAALPSSNGVWYVGRQWYYADTYKGQMDEMRIWNRTLTTSEIATDMCTPGTLPSGLVAYYNFNQGVALANNSGVTTLTDSSGNSRNGTLTNFALSGSTSNWVAPGFANGPICNPGPGLAVQASGVSLVNGNKINVPVTFTGNGANIASVGFALDYQESCLVFDATDSDSNGVPDAITGLPAAFTPSISHQPTKTSGELEVALYDSEQPITTFSDGTLFTVQFTVKAACLPSVGAPTTVAINFAASPAASFGSPTGQDVTGTATGATITLNLTNTAPTALSLGNSSVAENSAVGTTVGTFSTTDADSGDTHTYTLVSGTGSTDNASFTISGNTLKTAAIFNYEAKSSYTIRVRTTDSGGLFVEQSFTITVSNVYEAPTGVVVGSDGPYSDGNLATLDINENAPAGTTVATLAPANPNSGSTYTYTLVAGAGDNTLFTLTNGVLKANNPFDYETKNSYTVVVLVTDQQGNSFQQTLTLTVNNLTTETPVAVDDLVDPRVTVFRGGQAGTINVLANDIANGGTLSVASVTQPANSGGSVTNNTTNVSYTAPNASGSTTFTYQATNGTATSNNATVSVNYVANHARGDCNGNGSVAAADFIAVVLEIFDANNTKYQNQPAWWLSYTGDYAGSPLGCDANNSGNGIDNSSNSVTAADIICTVLIFFGHPCGGGVQAASMTATTHLAVADQQASPGASTALTVTLNTGGNAIAAATFALGLDPAVLHFDTTDADGDGVPDAIMLNTPSGMSKSVTWNPTAKRLEVAVFGMSLPLPTLQDGTLATVTIAVANDTAASSTPLALNLVSFSDADGNDLAFTEQDGTLTITGNNAPKAIFLPLVVR